MDTGTDYAAPFPDSPQRERDKAAVRGEDDGCIQRFRHGLISSSGPYRAKLYCKVLRWLVPGPCQGEDASVLAHGYLRDDMCGGAEAIDADALPRPAAFSAR